MGNSGKYAFGFLAFVCLIAGVVVFMEELTSTGEIHFLLPCGLVAMGLVCGFFALGMASDASDSLTCHLIRDSDDSQDDSQSDSKD